MAAAKRVRRFWGEAPQGRTRHGYHRRVLLLVRRPHFGRKHLQSFPLQIPTNRIGSTGIASCAHSRAYAQRNLGARRARRMAMRNLPFFPTLVRTCMWGTHCEPRLQLLAGILRGAVCPQGPLWRDWRRRPGGRGSGRCN